MMTTSYTHGSPLASASHTAHPAGRTCSSSLPPIRTPHYPPRRSDLLAELQGRLPIRVELKPLTEDDLYRILTEPDHNLVTQQDALMEAEGVQLDITDGVRRGESVVGSPS